MPASPAPARVVVAGATGRLGAIVDRLIGRGHTVLALTRDPRSAPGGELGRRGAEVAFADFDERAREGAAALTAVLDHPLEPVALDRSTLPAGLRALFAWLGEVGHAVDIAALRRSHPDVGWHDFGAWARAERHRVRELCPERATVS